MCHGIQVEFKRHFVGGNSLLSTCGLRDQTQDLSSLSASALSVFSNVCA